MKKFALIGAAGYVAPKHMKAIQDNNGELVAAIDRHDSVGILDSYFPRCDFFTEESRFFSHIHKVPVDYIIICSPNWQHSAHCIRALHTGANVICEKPLTLTEENLDIIQKHEKKTDRKVYPLFQLRAHSVVEHVRKFMKRSNNHKVEIDYCTPRGNWYDYSWKGDVEKSGGLATNIGVHLFDLCYYLFGEPKTIQNFSIQDRIEDGVAEFQTARVTWRLSTSLQDEPKRKFTINDCQYNFDNGSFNNLHAEVYRRILDDDWFSTEDFRPATYMCEELRRKNWIKNR